MRPFRCFLITFALAIGMAGSGCQMLEETWKWNRGPAMDEGDAYFSVSDPDATVSASR